MILLVVATEIQFFSMFQYCFRRQVALSDFQSQLALDSPMAMYSKVDRQQDYNSSKLQARHKVQVLYLID